MPLPKPKKDEKKKDFIDRCMSNDVMKDEYDDNDQRLAVCYSLWDKSKEKKSLEELMKKNNNGKMERRFYLSNTPYCESEVRVVRSDDKPTKIEGYFAKFNKLSRNLGWFFEIIEPGFFNSALDKSDPVDLFNHDANIVLGRMSSGTLRIWEDEVGLAYECTPPDTQLVRDMVLTPIERGDIRGCSFGFTVKRRGDDWDEDEEGRLIRTLLKDGCRELFDGSQVTFPAYPDTDVALRSMEEWRKNKSDDERKKQEELENKQKIDSEKRKKEKQDNEDNEDKILSKIKFRRIGFELSKKEKELNL